MLNDGDLEEEAVIVSKRRESTKYVKAEEEEGEQLLLPSISKWAF